MAKRYVNQIAILLFALLYGGPAAAQEPPVLSGIELSDLNYSAGMGNVTISTTISIDGTDSTQIISAIISISEGYIPAEDVLGFSGDDSLSADWDGVGGVLTVAGPGTLQQYQQLLRTIQYGNNSIDPTPGMRVFTFSVNDSTGSSNSVSRSLVIQEPAPGPTAEISGIDSICQGETAELMIAFTGTAPFDITLLRNNAPSEEINNIQTSSYILQVEQAGQYTLDYVKDAYSAGSVSGTGVVVLRNVPTAKLSGNASICGDQSALLDVELTGNPPWNFSYRRNTNTSVLIAHINEASTEIQVNEAGSYSLVEVSDQYCIGTVSGNATISLTAPPNVSISGLASSYSNKLTDLIPITGTPSGGEFSGNGVLYYENSWYFIPALAGIGINRIVYKYQASSASCFGYDTVALRIFEFGAEIVFEGERTKFCMSDPSFEVLGISLIDIEGEGSFIISGGAGLVDHGDNTATVNPAELAPGAYTITYTSADGTMVNRIFETGIALNADFTWDTECFLPGTAIDFLNNSSSPFGFVNNSSFLWKIYFTSETLSSSTRDMSYNFTGLGKYKVELQVENSYGCRDTAIKVISLQPVIALSGQNYFEDFEDENTWHTPDSATVAINSWQLGSPVQHGLPPQGFDGAFSGIKCWYTNIVSSLVPAEESWITSPCFNFTGTEKPTLVARIWRSFTDNRDGANLQYSTDNGKNWGPLGILNDGINWYNAYYGNSGDQVLGWTSVIDTGWVEIRHELDFLIDEPGVQFRFVYNAFGNAIGNNGLAIDDVRVVERNRTLLFEHFTNISDPKSALADSIIKNIAQQSGSNIIDIQYHTAEPGEDPFNADNPLIPGVRQFYYSITGVPYTIINGGTQASQRIDYNPGSIDRNRVKIESLYDSDFQIQVHTMIQSDSLYVEAILNAINEVPETELSVRMAVVEPLIEYAGVNGNTWYRNIVRTMLPDVAGTVIFKSWSRNEILPLRYSWNIQNVNEPADVRVVVFIQNEVTREIYQAAIDSRGIVTDINLPGVDGDQISMAVYPNPAQKQVFVKLNPGMEIDVRLELFNTIGVRVYSDQIFQGENIHSISVDALPEGIYLLRVSTPKSVLGKRKIVVFR